MFWDSSSSQTLRPQQSKFPGFSERLGLSVDSDGKITSLSEADFNRRFQESRWTGRFFFSIYRVGFSVKHHVYRVYESDWCLITLDIYKCFLCFNHASIWLDAFWFFLKTGTEVGPNWRWTTIKVLYFFRWDCPQPKSSGRFCVLGWFFTGKGRICFRYFPRLTNFIASAKGS